MLNKLVMFNKRIWSMLYMYICIYICIEEKQKKCNNQSSETNNMVKYDESIIILSF